MKRKTFISRMALGTGSALVLPSLGLLESCGHRPEARTALSSKDLPLLNAIADTIIPDSPSAPGAAAADVGGYILLVYQDCMSVEDQDILLKGINALDARASQSFSDAFQNASAQQREQLLTALQAEAIAYHTENEGVPELAPHYFDLLKGLTLNGYFTSEIGMTQAREYLPVPGKFQACIPYSHKDKVWAL